jgi:hypothetical protein
LFFGASIYTLGIPEKSGFRKSIMLPAKVNRSTSLCHSLQLHHISEHVQNLVRKAL